MSVPAPRRNNRGMDNMARLERIAARLPEAQRVDIESGTASPRSVFAARTSSSACVPESTCGTVSSYNDVLVAAIDELRATPASRATSDHAHLLLPAAALFAVAVLVHNGDHLRRGVDALDLDVFWVGMLAVVIETALVVLVCQRHRVAPLAAAAAGSSLAAGYVLVHFLPERSWLSDSFTSGDDISPLSWGAASLEVVAAVVIAVAGFAVLRARGGLASAMRPVVEQRSIGEALLHPLALAFLAGQVVITVVSFVQL